MDRTVMLLASGCWLLAAGLRLLAAGCCLLVRQLPASFCARCRAAVLGHCPTQGYARCGRQKNAPINACNAGKTLHRPCWPDIRPMTGLAMYRAGRCRQHCVHEQTGKWLTSPADPYQFHVGLSVATPGKYRCTHGRLCGLQRSEVTFGLCVRFELM